MLRKWQIEKSNGAQQGVITVVLLIGLCFASIALLFRISAWRLPDRETGYAPVQEIDVDHPLYVSFAEHHPSHPGIVAKEPLSIEFSHQLHAGELEMDCRFCHTAADKSRHAGIPSSDICFKCHKYVTTSFDVLQELLNSGATVETPGSKTANDAKPHGDPKRGKLLFQSFGCQTCHTCRGVGGPGGPNAGGEIKAPDLAVAHDGTPYLGSTIELADGTIVERTDEYILESIIDPGAKVVKDPETGRPYPANHMPERFRHLPKKDSAALVAYIKGMSGAATNGDGAAGEESDGMIISEKLKPLYHSLGLDKNLQPLEGVEPQSIPWVRVHNLADFVHFDHRAHFAAGVACQRCHGPVESMQRMRQYASLSMGWCINCHRESTENGINGKAVHASTDCAVCHY